MNIYNENEVKSYLMINDSVKREHYQESYVFMNEEEYEFFEERAAIMEFESRLPRKEAERLAYQRIVQNRSIYSYAS